MSAMLTLRDLDTSLGALMMAVDGFFIADLSGSDGLGGLTVIKVVEIGAEVEIG